MIYRIQPFGIVQGASESGCWTVTLSSSTARTGPERRPTTGLSQVMRVPGVSGSGSDTTRRRPGALASNFSPCACVNSTGTPGWSGTNRPLSFTVRGCPSSSRIKIKHLPGVIDIEREGASLSGWRIWFGGRDSSLLRGGQRGERRRRRWGGGHHPPR